MERNPQGTRMENMWTGEDRAGALYGLIRILHDLLLLRFLVVVVVTLFSEREFPVRSEKYDGREYS